MSRIDFGGLLHVVMATETISKNPGRGETETD